MKRARRGGAEREVHGRWRRLYCRTQKAAAIRKIKRNTIRRERREGRTEARRADDE